MRTVKALLYEPTMMFMLGVITLGAGLAMVLAHNIFHKTGHLETYNLKKFEDSSGTDVSAAAEATVEPLPFHVGELFRHLAAPDVD